MIVEILAAIIFLTEPIVTHYDSDQPVYLEGRQFRVGQEGATVKMRVACGPALRLTWNGVRNWGYRVEWSYDLKEWTSNNITVIGTGEPLEFFDGLKDDRKYYRVHCEPR